MSQRLKKSADTYPTVVEDEIWDLDPEKYIAEKITVLVFYPSNFGPRKSRNTMVLRACNSLTAEVDVDVAVFGVSMESVYAHKQFVHAADLSVPLISDRDGVLIDTYDIPRIDLSGQYAPALSILVFDGSGTVSWRWSADDENDTPPFETLRTELNDAGEMHSAESVYRLAHARYQEGRRYLSRGLSQCEEENWTLAKSAFNEACSEFGQATDLFIKSQGLASGETARHAEKGRSRSTKLWEATEWLAGFATAAKNGNPQKQQSTKKEADRVLTNLSDDDSLAQPDAILSYSK